MSVGRREAGASGRNQTTLLPSPFARRTRGHAGLVPGGHDARPHGATLRHGKMNCPDLKSERGVKSSSNFHPLEPRPNQTPTTVLKRMLVTIQS